MVARAATACYKDHESIQHLYALVRTSKQLDRVLEDVEKEPGIVLYTMLNQPLRNLLEKRCQILGTPAVSVLDPVHSALENFLNVEGKPVIGRQHSLDAQYFKRIDAMNYTLVHDDGQHPDDLKNADIIILGISRTSKTPTSFYLANRGLKVANIPFVTEAALPQELESAKNTFVVGLIATTEQVMQIRRHRLESMQQVPDTPYIDRKSINNELSEMKKICTRNNWPIVDVTRRSIEETSASILNLYQKYHPEFTAGS